MNQPDLIDELLSSLRPEQVPAEFVIMAKITLLDGAEKTMTGMEFENFVRDEYESIYDVKIMLNVGSIKDRIATETEYIFDSI